MANSGDACAPKAVAHQTIGVVDKDNFGARDGSLILLSQRPNGPGVIANHGSEEAVMTTSPRKYRARILRPIPYDDRNGGRSVAPVGSYDIAEIGEHFQFLAEREEPFEMPREHALQHHRSGHLHIEDWES